jgi:hypothetical protein
VPGRLPLAPSLAAALHLGVTTLFEVIGLFPIIAAGSSLAELDGLTRIIAVGPIIGVRGVTATKPYWPAASTHKPLTKKPAFGSLRAVACSDKRNSSILLSGVMMLILLLRCAVRLTIRKG